MTWRIYSLLFLLICEKEYEEKAVGISRIAVHVIVFKWRRKIKRRKNSAILFQLWLTDSSWRRMWKLLNNHCNNATNNVGNYDFYLGHRFADDNHRYRYRFGCYFCVNNLLPYPKIYQTASCTIDAVLMTMSAKWCSLHRASFALHRYLHPIWMLLAHAVYYQHPKIDWNIFELISHHNFMFNWGVFCQ